MLRDAIGTPMRMKERANSRFARRRARAVDVGELDDEFVRCVLGAPTCVPSGGVRHVEQELLHVPGAGRAALGAEPAMQADVLVLDHDAAGLERVGDVEVLGEVQRRGLQAAAQLVLRRR